jgi:hypothetical protein
METKKQIFIQNVFTLVKENGQIKLEIGEISTIRCISVLKKTQEQKQKEEEELEMEELFLPIVKREGKFKY